MVEELSPELDTHINRWHSPNDIEQWKAAVNRLEQFLLRRPNYLINRSNELFGFPIKTFPNPMQNQFSLELDAWSDGDVEVILFDINGIPVLQQTYPVLEGKQTISIETPNLINGTYLLHANYQSLSTNSILIKLK